MSLASEVLSEAVAASSRRKEVCMSHGLLHTILISHGWAAVHTRVLAGYDHEEAGFSECPVKAWEFVNPTAWGDVGFEGDSHYVVHLPASVPATRCSPHTVYVSAGAHLPQLVDDDAIVLVTNWKMPWAGLPGRQGARDYATLVLPRGTHIDEAVRIARAVGARILASHACVSKANTPRNDTPSCFDGYALHQ